MRPAARGDLRGNRRRGRRRRPRDPHIRRAAAAGGNRCRHAPLRIRAARCWRTLRRTAVEFYAPAAELKNIQLTLRRRGPAAGVGRSGAARAGAQQPDRQCAQVCAARTAPSTSRSAAPRGRRWPRSPSRTTDRASPMRRRPRSSSASTAAMPAAALRASGSGLSLVQAVAKLHGSALELADRNPGLRVVLAIPCIESQAAPSAVLAAGPAPLPAAEPAARPPRFPEPGLLRYSPSIQVQFARQ